MLLQHVMVTNCPCLHIQVGRQVAPPDTAIIAAVYYVLDNFCTKNCLCNVLGIKHIFVTATSCTNLIWFDFVWCCSNTILLGKQRFSQKILQFAQLKWFCSNIVLPLCVSTTCHLMSSNHNGLKFVSCSPHLQSELQGYITVHL